MPLTLTHTKNKYENVEPSSITSAVSSIEQNVSSNNGKLTSLESGLLSNEEIWKASAKTPLQTAFTKLTGEVTTEITEALEKAKTVATNVEEYKTNWEAASAAVKEYNSLEAEHDTSGTPATNPNYKDNSAAMKVQKDIYDEKDPAYQANDTTIQGIVGG